jgi:uncharacterized protein YhaN
MKILELDLFAFGPFAGRRLDLSAGQEGLHLVFGPNEAGKSSALRALRDLLFGIPERTRDDFRHAKHELRLGGRLRKRNGDELRFIRRKGRKSTLLDAEERPIGEDALAPFIGDLDERLFGRLFGIDHETLVSGGQTLLEERGREAEALFGTALGATAIHRVLDGLDQEAQGLFAPRASKPTVNALIAELAETERRLREASLSVRHWEHARASVDETTRDLARMDEEIEQVTRERSRLERIRRTLPELVRRTRLAGELAQIGHVPVLASDFATRREEAVAKRSRAGEARANARSRLEGLGATIRDLREQLSEGLLGEMDAVDDLREQLGSHRKAALDRMELTAELARCQAEAAALLRRVRPDLAQAGSGADIDVLRSILTRRRRSADLGTQKKALVVAAGRAQAELAETRERLAHARDRLTRMPAPVPSDRLEQVLDDARRDGDLDRMIIETRSALETHLKVCERELAALGLWCGPLRDLLNAPLPEEESLRVFAEEWRALEAEREALQQRRSDERSELSRCEETLRALELTGAVPSEEELTEARGRREQGWQIVKQAWLEGADVTAAARAYGADAPLEGAFEGAVHQADEIADRLRREAQHVHERASTRARREGCLCRIEETDRDLADVERRANASKQAWDDLWVPSGLIPRSPAEMLPWLNRAQRLSEKARQADQLRERCEVQEAIRRAHRTAVLAALGRVSEPGSVLDVAPELGPVIRLAEARLRELDEGTHSRLALEREVEELAERARRLGRELAEAEGALDAWQAEWTALMAELGLAADTTPGEVSDDLQSIADALKQIEAADRLSARIDGIDRDAAAFSAQARACLERLATDLLTRPVEEAVMLLHARSAEQRELRSRLDEVRQQASRAEAEIRESETAITISDQVLTELCRQAACDAPEQLPEIEERARAASRLAAELAEVESRLIRAGDGLGIEALTEEAAGIDQDRIVARLNVLDARLERELRPAHRALIERKADADGTLKAMGGDDAAAAIAAEAQQILAAIRTHSEQYVRLKLAARMLRDEIERFRRKHSDPILAHTSRYLEKLTCGAFSAVETDFDEADQPVLVGLRNNGERLRVEAMSTGTRDQLYLALRLANLEQYLETAEPIPFVVDDILIQFDDERALATLATLADFSANTQVILFTHHGRDIDQAARLDPNHERIHVHRLT